jgi:hypothetical protein
MQVRYGSLAARSVQPSADVAQCLSGKHAVLVLTENRLYLLCSGGEARRPGTEQWLHHLRGIPQPLGGFSNLMEPGIHILD